MMNTISLKDFYKKFIELSEAKSVYIESPYEKGGVFHLFKIAGVGRSGYVFLALYKKKIVALRMSYEKDDFEKKMHSIKMTMGEDYRNYILDLLYPAIPINRIYVKSEGKLDELFFNKEVFISVWERADVVLKDKLNESFEKKQEWFLHFLKGLSVIHSRDRLHLDIKLDSLFIVDGRLKIGDFDLYEKIEDFKNSDIKISGTPGYLAPELFYDRENVSTKVDIFSAGVAFCELFTGSIPGRDLYNEDVLKLPQGEEKKLKELFNNKHLTIKNRDIESYKLFIKNFRIFSFFIQELKKKNESAKLSGHEHFIYNLVLKMTEIDPEKRIDVNNLLFEIQKKIFDPLSLLGEVLSERYQVQDLIDEGGRAVVYKVLDQTEGKVKAIKLFPPQFSFIKGGFSEIINELTLAGDITHRNIVRIYGLERDGDLNFIVMEYIDGYNLNQILEAEPGKKLREELALFFMKQAASGLMEAHKKGIIHRNLNDRNIMITTAENSVKIINFGLSRRIRKSIFEITGELYGTRSLLFIPPEQLEKESNEENEQTDVWAFGAILYKLLSGKAPFAKDDETRDPFTLPPIPEISERTKNVIMKCLEKDRRKRYRNAQEIYNALPGDADTIEAHKTKLTGKAGAIRKWIFPLVLGIIAAALLVIAGIKIFRGGDTYRMWYSGSPGDSKTPGGGVGYAVSTDGVEWKRSKYNPVIPHGAKDMFNEFESALPYVVTDGKRFYMLFRAGKSSGDIITYSVGYAESPDGSIWDKDKIKTLNDENIKSPGPVLYSKEGLFTMWYPDSGDVYYACTKNKGESITKLATYQTNPVVKKGNTGEWDENEITPGTVLFENGVYKMWYTGKSGNETKIGYAVSPEGINWAKYPFPVFDDKNITNEMNPVIIHDSNGFKMYYTAATGGRDYSPVLLAVSTDGIKWQKHSNIPVLDTGSDWEKTKVSVTTVSINKRQ